MKDAKPKQQSIAPPKPGLLSPRVAELVGQFLVQATREDSNSISEYLEMCRTSPIIGALLDLIRLYAQSMMGEYDNENDDYKAFILRCFELMDGSVKMAVDQLMIVKPLGYAVAEWAPIERDSSYMLDSIQILDPAKYRFEGKLSKVEQIVYDGESGDIIIPYDRCIHLTNQNHLSFNSPFGVADCRRVYAPYKAWKITIAAAVIAAKRRGEPIIVGFAPSDQQVQVGTDQATGEAITIAAPAALLQTLQDLDSNSVAATDLENKVQLIEAAEGTLIMDVLKELERLQLLGFLVPETILAATGVGDSSLNSGHRSILDLMVGSTIDQIKERLIEDVVRPLLIWEFGEKVEDFGSFPTPKTSDPGAIEMLNAIATAVYNGAFSAADLDVINRMRDLAGLPTVTEVAEPLAGAPTETPAIDDAIAGEEVPIEEDEPLAEDEATFAAAPKGRGGKGRKKGKGQKNCNKGVNCGGTCISAKKKCKKDNPSPAVKAKAKRPAKSKGGGGGGATEEGGKPQSGAVVLDNYDRIKTDWADGIKQGKLYAKLNEFDYDLKRNQDYADGYKSESGNKFNWQGRVATKAQILADLASDREAITRSRAAFAEKNKLDPNANTSRIFDSLEVANSLKTEGRSKKIQKGAIEIDGTIAAAFSYRDTGKSLYVNFLGANPADIIAGQSRGAGTAAIKALVQRSIDSGHGGALDLQAKRGANSFYESRGFTLGDRAANRYTLSPEAARKLLGDK